MQPYFMNFHVKGEVAGILLLKGAHPKLLVDLSPNAATESEAPGYRYPTRVGFCIRDLQLIKRFQNSISVGDVIEAHGSFDQTGYVPQGNRHVDTTFEMRSFQQRNVKLLELSHGGRTFATSAAALRN